tara:strand:- start:406 stop:2274 length:1869 start_codon:yes stop_codon:yes gene_type:complete
MDNITTSLNEQTETIEESESELTEQAEVVLNHRYYLKDIDGEVIENNFKLFRRVAKAISSIEKGYKILPVEATLLEKDFYSMLSNLEFIPNSPTLMNAGTEQGTLSACFVLPLEDSMEDIMKTAHDIAMVQKYGGGTGFALSKLRPKGDRIKTTHGIACGPIAVLRTLSQVSSMITQGGKRDGANMAIMAISHPDIEEFISCKAVEGDIHNFNISVGVDTKFMEAVKNNTSYPLVNPNTKQITKWIDAREIFSKIVDGAWRNGEPGMIFLDRINEDNVVIDTHGEMIATNPCGEQPLLSNESCNLGSINLAKFYIDTDGNWQDKIDWDNLKKVTTLSTHFLDNVIDANKYATKDIEEMTKATRKIGLGVMGFADLLIQLRIPYNTKLAREVGESLMQFIREETDNYSKHLANLRGVYPSGKDKDEYRNACRMTVAPTGTISMIAGCSSGIEPTFALVWKKANILEGKTLYYSNKYFEEDAKEHGFYSEDLMEYLSKGNSLQDRDEVPQWVKEVYITSPEISPEAHVLMQSVFQKSVDSGISKTINFPNEATREDVQEAYLLAWETGCKGITVYRAGSREKEVLVKGTDKKEEPFACCDSPNIIEESGCETCKSCGWSLCHVA